MDIIEKLIGAIADVEETDPQYLTITLQDWVDADAIRELEAHGSDSWELQFEVRSYDVTIRADETILIDGVERQPSFEPSEFVGIHKQDSRAEYSG